jgi:hypothetical protein
MYIFGLDQNLVVTINLLVNIVLLILVIMLSVIVTKLVTSYRKLTNGSSPDNLEQLIIEIQSRLSKAENNNKEFKKEITNIKENLKTMKSKVAIHRYDPFSNTGNKYSFSIAILDDNQNGVVITSLYNGDSSFIYAKAITDGKSDSAISKEEQAAIDEASMKNK